MSLNIVKDIDSRVAVKHVLMSVSDKTGLEAFVPALVKACPGVKIYSTGGTLLLSQQIVMEGIIDITRLPHGIYIVGGRKVIK